MESTECLVCNGGEVVYTDNMGKGEDGRDIYSGECNTCGRVHYTNEDNTWVHGN